MKLSVVAVESHLKSRKLYYPNICISVLHFMHIYCIDSIMNKFEFKNLVKNLKDSLKEKKFFKDLRKEVETGANGTQDYVVKKGVNKDTIATTKQ